MYKPWKYKPWEIDGKRGNIYFPEGEVIYQTKGIVIQPVYVTVDEGCFIEEDGRLIPAPMSPYNGYCYRQDGL